MPLWKADVWTQEDAEETLGFWTPGLQAGRTDISVFEPPPILSILLRSSSDPELDLHGHTS